MTQRDRIVVLVVAVLAVLGGYYFMALKPKRNDVHTAQATIDRAQAQLATANDELASARQSKAKYPTNYATVANLGKAVPIDDEVPSLIYQLQAAAKKTGIGFDDVTLKQGSAAAAPTTPSTASATVTATLPPGAAVGAAGFPTMPFALTFRGSFFKLQGFLAEINGMTTIRKNGNIRVRGRLLQIDGVGLQAGPKGFPDVTAKLAATAYVLPSDEGLANGGTPSNPSATTPAQDGIQTSEAAR